MARHPVESSRVRSIRFTKDGIDVDFKPTRYDELAWYFASELIAQGVNYAIVSGYSTILLGRSRTSEDIDILAEPISELAFLRLHKALLRNLDCISPGAGAALYRDYLNAGDESTSVRYSWPGDPVPNVEFKFAQSALHRFSIAKRLEVRARGECVHIGPLEVQIGYKLWLGSEKDLEDARWIYRFAKGHLDEAEIWATARKLGVNAEKGRRALNVD